MAASPDALPQANRTEHTPTGVRTRRRGLAMFPWWFLVLALAGVAVLLLILNSATYRSIFVQLRAGIVTTLFISSMAYLLATVLGLLVGLARSYPPTEQSGMGHIVAYNCATLHVEIFRGLPVLVVLLIVEFVAFPALIEGLNEANIDVSIRDIPLEWRAIAGLALTYSAYLAEVFRSGIQAVPGGQREAARSLGMTPLQTTRHIVFPQAARVMLPPLGNELISMIKDSSLVAIIAVQDITQLAKLSSGRSFRYIETYLIAAMIYLAMTIIGSLLVRALERRLRIND